MLAAAGARILLAGRNAARLRAVAAETGGIALAADLAVPDGPAALAEAAIRAAATWDCGGCGAAAARNGIDILINNAGVGWAGPLTEMSAATVAHVIAVNLTAPIELTRLLTPTLGAGGRGRVVFISSIAGTTGVTHEAVYAATKAGLGCFAESLLVRAGGHGRRGVGGRPRCRRHAVLRPAGAPLRPHENHPGVRAAGGAGGGDRHRA